MPDVGRAFVEYGLVSPRWLAEHLGHPAVRVLDVRTAERRTAAPGGLEHVHRFADPAEYEAGHVPGALPVAFEEVACDDGVAARPPVFEHFRRLASRWGISPQTHVVIYDHQGSTVATRLWWTFRAFGHGRVSVLDGGWQEWVAQGFPVRSGPEAARPAAWAGEPVSGWLVSAEEVARRIREGGATLIDTRSPDQFAAGRIPGALNVPAGELRGPGGRRFRELAELEALFAARGVPTDRHRHIIAYCRSGVSATAVLLHLDRLGYRQLSLFAGSWNEWVRRFAGDNGADRSPAGPGRTGGGGLAREAATPT